MSYLDLPRIVFTGDFISDVSTVNNDPQHYNNQTFKPNFQKEKTAEEPNGWWNPEGGATFDFKDCTIQKITYADGTSSDSSELDNLIGEIVTGAEGRSLGKMVDLDPQQQGVSELWAVKLRILNSQGEALIVGDLAVTAFRDLQMRQHQRSTVNGQGRGASWTTVLENIIWSDKANKYRVFKELKEETQENKLSINLNGFGYYYKHNDGRFSMGKILGGIGPWYEDEPITFTAERRLYGVNGYGLFGASNFKLDQISNRLTIDFGNSFPISDPQGDISFNFNLFLGYANTPITVSGPSNGKNPTVSKSAINLIGQLDYNPGNWLIKTGGIVDIENAPDDLKDKQLVLFIEQSDQYLILAREAINGYNLRADQMVLRIDTHDTIAVNFFARKWGQKISNASIEVQLQQATKPKQGNICTIPGTGYPQDGVAFSKSSISVTDGLGTFKITGNPIQSPREYLDGQIYFVGYWLSGVSDAANNVGDAISIHLRDEFKIPDTPKWSDIQETMQQFSNLYPIMSKYIVDLGDREAVLAKKDILLFAFNQSINSPIYMPVTRDLSEGKRKTILKWLESDGKVDLEAPLVAGTKNILANESIEVGSEPSDLVQKLNLMMKMKMAQSQPELEIEPNKLFDYA